jgi:aryl-alcohol dehydrogenase-like predicted oxidoreductase
VVAQYNQYAKDHVTFSSRVCLIVQGLRPFSVYEGHWNCSERDFEREIIPMARTLGLALVPWGALGGGKFKTEAQIAELKKRNEQGRVQFQPPSDEDRRITSVLEKLAQARGPEIGLTGIALAYVMHKAPDVFPLVGGRKIEHLKQNIAALNVRLSAEDIKEIESAGGDFKAGFPYNLLGGGEPGAFEMKDVVLLRPAGYYDFHEATKVPLIPE